MVEALGELVFVGLGLYDEMGISLQGLEEVKTAGYLFVELYTSLMPDFSIENFQRICGKKVRSVSRKEIEEENGEAMLEPAKAAKVVLLVPGDPLIATTHVALRIHAEKLGIKTRIVHGASVLSAVIGLSGLHSYKFGKSVTIPIKRDGLSETPYEVISQNRKLDLHTLCLLDIDVKANRYLKIREAVKTLLRIEEKRKEGTVLPDTLIVGVARAGSSNPTVKAGFLEDLLRYDFGGPPHSIVFPGKLHFTEAEALTVLADAPERLGMTTQ